MLNIMNFTLLAGNPHEWDKETMDRVGEGEDLVRVQEDQHRRGRRSAHLVEGIGDGTPDHRFYVRSASGLDDFCILLRGWHTREEAIAWGKAWANEDPGNREFFAHKRFLKVGSTLPPGA